LARVRRIHARVSLAIAEADRHSLSDEHLALDVEDAALRAKAGLVAQANG
jgi:hypothetical protein